METVFKVGDKVFMLHTGWVIITSVEIKSDSNLYPSIHYTYDEGLVITSLPIEEFNKIASFTEYELKGFSQERPKEDEKFEKGQVVYVSNYKEPFSVECGKFASIIDSLYVIKTNHGYDRFKYCWSKNPLLEEKEEKKYFKPEIGKWYYFYDDLKDGYVYGELIDIRKDFDKHRYAVKTIGYYTNISETNPLDNK